MVTRRLAEDRPRGVPPSIRQGSPAQTYQRFEILRIDPQSLKEVRYRVRGHQKRCVLPKTRLSGRVHEALRVRPTCPASPIPPGSQTGASIEAGDRNALPKGGCRISRDAV